MKDFFRSHQDHHCRCPRKVETRAHVTRTRELDTTACRRIIHVTPYNARTLPILTPLTSSSSILFSSFSTSFLMSHPHTDLDREKQFRPPTSPFHTHKQSQGCTCHHVHFHHHPHLPHYRFGKMSEEILFDRSMIDKYGRGFVGNGNGHERFGNYRHDIYVNDRGGNDRAGNGLNPRARSFFVCPPSPRLTMS